MKKILGVVVVLILVFSLFTYLSISSTTKQFKTCEILNSSVIDTTNFSDYDSILVAANTLYDGDWVKKFMQGEQYREAWAAPVRVPIVFLDTLLGGLQIVEEGGGMQTHSLELSDAKGIRYALRSISKDPSPMVPEVAQTLGLENIVVDGVSAQHPYAAIVVADLAEAANVPHTNPIVYFVPKQTTLGKFNDKFGNRLYLFEYETEGEVDWTNYENVVELLDTEDVQEWKKEGEPITIDYPLLIRARLFDLIIGDWDRHAKQWGWAIEKKEGQLIAHPIAGDRDNAFFKQEGVLPSIISNDILLPEMQSFEHDIEYMQGLVRPFDVYFLRNTSIEQFVKEAKYLQKVLTDERIDRAFAIWPNIIYALDAEEIKSKLKARAKGIVSYAKSFKRILDERELEPIVLKGSEEM